MRAVSNKNIGMCILLSFLTCGIYGIIWFINLNDDMCTLVEDEYNTSGGMAFLLTLVTCGIYGFYWAYKMGQKTDVLKQSEGDSAILFLILQIFGLGIVNYCIMQGEINKYASPDAN